MRFVICLALALQAKKREKAVCCDLPDLLIRWSLGLEEREGKKKSKAIGQQWGPLVGSE